MRPRAVSRASTRSQSTKSRRPTIGDPSDFRRLESGPVSATLIDKAMPIPRPATSHATTRPFRPLELSIYLPGNELPDLPIFLSSITLDDLESKRRKRTSSLPVLPTLNFTPGFFSTPKRYRANTLTLEHKPVTVIPSAPLPSARPIIVGSATSPVPGALVPGPPSARTQSFYAHAGALLLASTLESDSRDSLLAPPPPLKCASTLPKSTGPCALPSTAGTAASAFFEPSPLDLEHDLSARSPAAFSFESVSAPATRLGTPAVDSAMAGPSSPVLARRVTSPVQAARPLLYPKRASSIGARTLPVPVVNIYAPPPPEIVLHGARLPPVVPTKNSYRLFPPTSTSGLPKPQNSPVLSTKSRSRSSSLTSAVTSYSGDDVEDMNVRFSMLPTPKSQPSSHTSTATASRPIQVVTDTGTQTEARKEPSGRAPAKGKAAGMDEASSTRLSAWERNPLERANARRPGPPKALPPAHIASQIRMQVPARVPAPARGGRKGSDGSRMSSDESGCPSLSDGSASETEEHAKDVAAAPFVARGSARRKEEQEEWGRGLGVEWGVAY